MSDVQTLEASALDVFVALHDFAWHYNDGESTSDLAEHLSSPAGVSEWRGSVIYATRFRPALDNTAAVQLSSAGSGEPGRILTLAEGHQAAVELVSFHNPMGTTEVWWFVEYLNSDPAAWTNWLTCMHRVLAVES